MDASISAQTSIAEALAAELGLAAQRLLVTRLYGADQARDGSCRRRWCSLSGVM